MNPSDRHRLREAVRGYESAHASQQGSGVPFATDWLPGFELRRFELCDALVPSGDGAATFAEAYLVLWDAATEEYVAQTDVDTFDVCDLTGKLAMVAGSRGTCYKPHDCPQWEIFQAATPAAAAKPRPSIVEWGI